MTHRSLHNLLQVLDQVGLKNRYAKFILLFALLE